MIKPYTHLAKIHGHSLKAFILSGCIACLLFSSVAFSDNSSGTFTAYFFQDIENKYGARARKRAEKWQHIIAGSKTDNKWKQIHKINHFFNQTIKEQDDSLIWGQKDYWASPLETISKGYGDCEDYAIAKFFSLRELGIPENKLRLLYARQIDNKQPHMVLIYYENAGAQPLVLDGKTGLRVDGESLERVAEGIVKLLSDKTYRLEQGEQAMKRARAEFSWEAVASRTEERVA